MSVSQMSKPSGQLAWPEGSANHPGFAALNLLGQWRQWLARHSACWQAQLADSEALRVAAARDRNLPRRCHAPYISTAFDLATRCAIVEAHYRFLQSYFPLRMHEPLLNGRAVRIAQFALGRGESTYLYLRAPILRSSGELGLYLLTQDKCVLASCTLTFAGRHGLLIGALHGSWAFMGKQPIRAFTRAAHGLRPKNLLLSLVYALGAFFELSPLRAVGDAVRPATADKAWRGTSQNAFWRENGGTLDEDGCYLLPPWERHRPLDLLPSKRRATRRRREAFRADVCEQMLFALRYAQSPAQARSSLHEHTAAYRENKPHDEDIALPARSAAPIHAQPIL